MITELGINKDQLKILLESKFSIMVKNIIFKPEGEVSWSYIIECEDSKYFLKIHKKKDLNVARLQLLFDLHFKCNIGNIAYPVKTINGELEIEVNDYPAVLFNFIEGVTSRDQELSDSQLEDLGELIARIHQSKDIIGGFDTKETFTHPFRLKIEKIYSVLERFTDLNKVQEEAKQIYQQYKAIFLQELNVLDNLAEQLKQENLEFVNCHGEPSPNNIMISPNGTVYLIDWDEPIFAPKEKDLNFFNSRLEKIMQGYKKFSKDTQVNSDVMRYYTLWWNISEIEDWGTRIFFEEHPLNEYQYYLNHLKYFLDYSGLGKELLYVKVSE